jgi:hypothetical protein
MYCPLCILCIATYSYTWNKYAYMYGRSCMDAIFLHVIMYGYHVLIHNYVLFDDAKYSCDNGISHEQTDSFPEAGEYHLQILLQVAEYSCRKCKSIQAFFFSRVITYMHMIGRFFLVYALHFPRMVFFTFLPPTSSETNAFIRTCLKEASIPQSYVACS